MPLHIFEPRYREMMADVERGDGLIGMMLLKEDWEEKYYGYPDIYNIGCAGRVGDVVKLPDGRYNLMLEGMSEFRVTREIRERSYRQVEVEWCPTRRTALELDDESMEGLHELLVGYVGDVAAQAWKSLVEEQGMRGAELINFICFHLDIPPIEKQTLLEAGPDRVNCLFDILIFRLEERKAGGPGGVQ